jgi:hypothetical protein
MQCCLTEQKELSGTTREGRNRVKEQEMPDERRGICGRRKSSEI